MNSSNSIHVPWSRNDQWKQKKKTMQKAVVRAYPGRYPVSIQYNVSIDCIFKNRCVFGGDEEFLDVIEGWKNSDRAVQSNLRLGLGNAFKWQAWERMDECMQFLLKSSFFFQEFLVHFCIYIPLIFHASKEFCIFIFNLSCKHVIQKAWRRKLETNCISCIESVKRTWISLARAGSLELRLKNLMRTKIACL